MAPDLDVTQFDLPSGNGPLIVDADHPSLDAEHQRFFEALRAEPRYFGPSASTNPKPYPSLIDALRSREGFRLAAVDHGRVVGLARVAPDGELFIAIVADRRGTGVGTALGRAMLQRAARSGHGRVVMRSSRRSRAARRVGTQLGGRAVDRPHGRTEMIFDPAGTLRRSA